MIWLLLCVVGLAVETVVIIALGRHATSRYEAEEAPDPRSDPHPLWGAPRPRSARMLGGGNAPRAAQPAGGEGDSR
jgi:hypothetical protein